MNTIHNYSRNNYYTSSKNAVQFTGAKENVIKKIASSSMNKLDDVSEQLNKLRDTYFKQYSIKDKVLIKLGLKVDNSPQMAVFDYLGVKPYLTPKGSIGIARYGEIEQEKILEMGLDEAKVFEPVCNISENGDFRKSSLKEFKNLYSVGNNLYLNESKINKLGNLEFVGRHVYLNDNLSKKDFKGICVNGCILR